MAEAAKYMFDRTFSSPGKGTKLDESAAALKKQEEWERKTAEATMAAYEEGQAEGRAEALKGIEEATRAETAKLIGSVEKLMAAVETECNGIRRNAIELAIMTAKLLAGELIARYPEQNFEALFTEALEHIDSAPHLALTVNDSLAESVQKSITAIASERGYTGKILVLGDPETKQGDCSLQWADGGISLDTEKTASEVEKIVKRHLERLKPPSTAQNPSVAQSHNGNGAQPHTAHAKDENMTATAVGSGEMQ